VRDADKQKMSKTKGNVIDPLDINERYGTDAVRLSLLIAVAPGTDIVYTEDRAAAAQKFANKIWNAARLISMNMERSGVAPGIPDPGQPEHLEDRWIFSLLNRTAELVNRAFEQHRYHEAADRLWHFFWHDFCDWYLEIKKLRLAEDSGLTNDWRNLLNVFGTYLRLQHPLMPFITEELWRRFGQTTSISREAYPEPTAIDSAAEHEMTVLQEMVTAARNLRADHQLDKKQELQGIVYCRNGAERLEFGVVEKLANVKLEVRSGAPPKLERAVRSTAEFDLLLELPEVDVTGQRVHLEKEIENLSKLIVDKDRQLGNEKFLNSAPPAVVESLRQKRREYQAQLEKSQAALAGLK